MLIKTENDAALQADLKLPASMASLPPLLAFAREYSAGMGFGERDIEHLLLALEEAVANIIQHGYGHDEQASFDIRFSQSPAGITVVLREKGFPFDPDKVVSYSPLELASKDAQGLGMYLIKKAMDKVEYLNLGRQGMEIRLTKYLKSKMPPAETKPLATADTSLAGSPADFSVTIRPFANDDALEISRCAYLAYGYSYVDFIYYPERIMEANRQGLLYSLVAVAADSGTVIGHVALKFKTPGDSIAEMGVAFVRPEYRGAGILGLLTDRIIEYARQIGLDGIYVEAVTSHTVSQRKAERYGLVTCAIMLGLLPSDVEFKQLTGRVSQKVSAVVSFKLLGTYPPVKLYPPVKHSRQIAALYRGLGIDATCLEAKPGDIPQSASDIIIQTSHDTVLNSAHIEVLQYGDSRQVLREIKAYLHKFCIGKVDAIFLHLDLTAPQTALLAKDFERMGFFFAGILPGGRSGRETLIMQYLNMDLDYGQVLLSADDAKNLLQYIGRNDPHKKKGQS